MDLKNVAHHEGFADQMAEVDSAIRDIILLKGTRKSSSLLRGVPRIRPVLIYLSSEIGSIASHEHAEKGRLMHLALSAELFYSAVLVHDLALGETGSKRRAVLKKILGRALRLHEKSWHGGNHQITRSFELVMMTKSSDIMSEFVRSMREVQDAQKSVLDLESFPTSEDVLSFIETYTGEMFAFACRAGGMMAKAPRTQYNLLARYGRELGVAWHLTEELAHLEGNNLAALEDQIGLGRPFYTVAFTAEQDETIRAVWQDVQADKADVSTLMEVLHRSKAIPLTRQKVAQRVWSARRLLKDLPKSSHRDQLDHLATALAK